MIFPQDFIDKIHLETAGNSEVLKQLPNESIDLVITSPPYKDTDGYSEKLMSDIFNECYRVQKNDTLLFLNFGHLAEDKFRPFKVAQIIQDKGYVLTETFVWVKNHYKPIQGNRRVNNLTEFIFMFYKTKMPVLNRLDIGIAYQDKSNIGRYSDKDLKCAGNVWYINYETINKKSQKLHNDRFPNELPLKCIKLCGYAPQVILDPFMGSGTTALACKKLKRNFIGLDIFQKNIDVAYKRLLGAPNGNNRV
jgi:site-specific DNA-methyltransferase (adenine-specific)